MLRLLAAELTKLRKSPLVLIGFVGGAFGSMLNVLVALNRLRDAAAPYAWEPHLQQTLMFQATIGGTLVVGFAATYIFVSEASEDTLKNILITPFPRWAVYIAKLMALLLWVLAVSAWGYISVILVGVAFGFTGGTVELVLSYAPRWLFSGLGLFAVASLAVTVSLMSKNYPVPVGYLIFASLFGIFAINWDQSYLIPWVAPLLAFGRELNTLPLRTIVVVFTAATAFNLTYFTKMDVH